MSHVVVSPAYGRDYKSGKDAKADWESGKDFVVQSMFGGGTYINKEDAKAQGVTSVQIRFKRMANLTVVKVK